MDHRGEWKLDYLTLRYTTQRVAFSGAVSLHCVIVTIVSLWQLYLWEHDLRVQQHKNH